MKKYLSYISTARKILEVVLTIFDKILEIFNYVEIEDIQKEDRKEDYKKAERHYNNKNQSKQKAKEKKEDVIIDYNDEFHGKEYPSEN